MDTWTRMSCAFDMEHYAELLAAAKAGGYGWASFDRIPRPGDVFLRHDVDLSLEAALEMARLEHELGVRATYFLMTESAFYNLDSHVGHYAQRQLRQWGHAVGLHAVHPRAELDSRFDAVVAWHNPDPEYVNEPIVGAVNVMEEPYFTKGLYRSDSNQHWREGCPHDELAAGAFEWLQLLVHPEIWVYDGATMGETMRAMLDAKREDWLELLRNDRIDSRMTTVLLSAAGAPGAARLIRALRENGEREVRVVGTDMSDRAIGKHLCDAFHVVPAGSDPGYADAIRELVERERVDVVLPQSSFDLEGLAGVRETFPVPVLVSSPETIHRSNDKAESYALLQRIGVPTVEFRRVAGAQEVEAAARELGYPERPGLLQAGVLVRLARLPDPRPDGRPRAPAAARTARLRGDDARRGGGAAPGRHDGTARDGARDRRRADDRRHRRRRARRARPPEDARGDARRARDVFRHARGSGADGDRRDGSCASCGSSGSSTSSSSATA